MHSAEDFFDDWAPFYDAYYAAREIGDVEFYVDLARGVEGAVLEVGCGTGRIYLELLRAGVDAYGIDVSAGMLDVLEDRAAGDGLEPRVRRADVTTFEPEREYELVIVPFRTFLHVLTLEDQQAALETLREALEPGGRLTLNFFVPNVDVMCESYGEPRTEPIEHDGIEYVTTTMTEFVDDVESIVRERRTLVHDGEILEDDEYRLKLVSKREFELLLETTGWSEWTVYGGFDRQPLEDATQEMVWIVER